MHTCINVCVCVCVCVHIYVCSFVVIVDCTNYMQIVTELVKFPDF